MKTSSLCLLTLAASLFIATAAEADPYCREYTQVVRIGSTQQKAYGTACLQADGSWQMIPGEGQAYPPAPPQTTTYIIHENQMLYSPPPPIVDIVIGRDRFYRNHWHAGHDRYARYERHDGHDRGRHYRR